MLGSVASDDDEDFTPLELPSARMHFRRIEFSRGKDGQGDFQPTTQTSPAVYERLSRGATDGKLTLPTALGWTTTQCA